MIGLLHLLATAQAADAQVGVAVEALPQSDGESWTRSRVPLRLGAELGDAWSLTAAGELRTPTLGLEEAWLQRLSVHYEGDSLGLTAGRFLDLNPAGRTRVDGVALDLRTERMGTRLYGGRIGHAEALDATGDLGAGALLWLAGGPMWGGLGYHFRADPEQLLHTVQATGSYSDGTGFRVQLLAEYGLFTDWPDPDATDEETEESEESEGRSLGASTRGSVFLRAPMGTRAALGARVRWIGLPSITVPWAAAHVEQQLSPDGYGVAELSAELNPPGPFQVVVGGGPTLVTRVAVIEEPEPDGPLTRTALGVGGTGRVVVGMHEQGSVFLGGTAVGGSWYAGGGLQLHRAVGPAELRGQAGLYRFQALDQHAAWVGEGRVQATVELPWHPAGADLDMGIRAAAGSDRLLSPWGRVGVAFNGHFGHGGVSL